MNKQTISTRFQSQAYQMVEAFIRSGFQVQEHDPIPYGYKIRLGCKVVITLYESGTILVQGNYDFDRFGSSRFQLLTRILPLSTKWKLGELRDNQYAVSLQCANKQAKQQSRGAATQRT
jgi:hypothetical protein